MVGCGDEDEVAQLYEMEKKVDKPNVRLGIFEGRYSYSEIKVGSKTGETLMAFDEETLEFVVIKRPSPTQPNPDARKASIADLEREEKVLRTQDIRDHPAVCRLLSASNVRGRDTTYRYLVLARARGIPFPALIQQYHDQGHPLPESVYLNVMRQLLDLLVAAHRVGIVYNDVKADHLFWDEKAEQLKVIDWGNAQFLGAANTASPATDVFQCGELLYEFISGDKYVPVSLRDWEASGRPPWGVPVYQPVDGDLRAVLSTALHPNPKQRFADAGQMAQALESYYVKKYRPATPSIEAKRVNAEHSVEQVSLPDEKEREESQPVSSISLEKAATPKTPPEPPSVKAERVKVQHSVEQVPLPDDKEREESQPVSFVSLEKAATPKTPSATPFAKAERVKAEHSVEQVPLPNEKEREESRPVSSVSLERAAMPKTPPVLPEIKRRSRQKVKSIRTIPFNYQRWVTAGVVVVAVSAGLTLAGLTVAGFFTEFGRGLSQGSPIAAITFTETPASTLTQPLSPTTVDPTQQACGKILEAEHAGLWESVIQQAGVIMVQRKPPATACGNRDLTQIVANARLQLQCAQARATKDPSLIQQMAREFGANEVQTQCGLNPAEYAATVTPPTTDVDLLASLAARRQSALVCPQTPPCLGGLYQDDSRRWHWLTLFFSQGVYLPLDEQFQTRAVDQVWGEKIRGFDMELSVVSNNPSSFAYSSEAGLEIRSVQGKVMRLSLMSQPVFSAAVNLVDPDGNKSVCDTALKSVVIVDSNGDIKRHKFSFKWKPEGSLQLFVDDQPLCKDSIPFPTAPRVALYLNGRGIDFYLSRLTVILTSP